MQVKDDARTYQKAFNKTLSKRKKTIKDVAKGVASGALSGVIGGNISKENIVNAYNKAKDAVGLNKKEEPKFNAVKTQTKVRRNVPNSRQVNRSNTTVKVSK